jgi:tripartite-type tricarboxylate transporter receptor subunit TctC
VLERFATLGVEPMPFSQAQFAAFVRDDVAANSALVKAAKIPTQ